MAELDDISATLRLRRKNIDEMIESTSSRTIEAGDLIKKIEELRRRSEQTQQPSAERRR